MTNRPTVVKPEKFDSDVSDNADFKKGMEAKNFVNNPLWIEAIQALEAMYLNDIKANGWLDKLDKNKREEACRRIQVVEDLKNYFEVFITKGEQARKRLEAKK